MFNDVQEMLGMESKGNKKDSKEPIGEPKLKRPKGMSVDLYNVLGETGMHSLMPVQNTKREKHLKSRWVWRPFANSARKDKLELSHWVPARKVAVDYPFAKMNKQSTVVEYTIDEYRSYLQSTSWTRQQTDHLLHLCKRFNFDWVVITDRYKYTNKTTEQLKERYHWIVKKLSQVRAERSRNEEFLITSANILDFNFQYEVNRAQQLNHNFNRTKKEEEEEEALLKRLQDIEVQLRKLEKEEKKYGSRISPDIDIPQHLSDKLLTALTGKEDVMEFLKPDPVSLPKLAPGPHLSSKYYSDTGLAGVGPRMTKKVLDFMEELGVPREPVPSPAICKLMSGLKHSIVALLFSHDHVAKLEQDLREIRQIKEATAHQPPILPRKRR
eukprot:TRINITY_DN1770_c0_g3_i2.p1 TRINITY_DN1770_c0_g3~~TRINITY_DN1770_c0_g3_i2.p1  ORF type:complete len:383 (+),score=98.15 TRINITY_DN1770_c0_g3_i2:183-1331(+)